MGISIQLGNDIYYLYDIELYIDIYGIYGIYDMI